MKHTHIFGIIFSVGLGLSALISCGKENTGGEENYDSSFVLDESILKTDVLGGRFICEYGISGPQEGRTADVESKADWIEVTSVFSSEFSLRIAENTTGKDRTGEIRLSCDKVKPVKISVIQSGKKSEDPIFKNYRIEVSGITTTSCRIGIVPVNASKTYSWGIVRKSDYDGMTAEECIKTRIEQIKQYAAMYGMSPAAFLQSGNLDTDKLNEDQRPSVYDRTDYYVTAFDLAYDESTKAFSYSGDIDVLEFKSASAPVSSMTLTIKQNGDLITISSSSSSETFVCDYMKKAYWDELESPDYAAHIYISTMLSYNMLELRKGSCVIDLSSDEDMKKGDKYVVYAAGYRSGTADSGLTTEVWYLEFTY